MAGQSQQRKITMGVPHMKALYDDLIQKESLGRLSTDEEVLLKKLAWAILRLKENPQYPGLKTHEIDDLSKRFSRGRSKQYKVWQSYLENNTPAAGRIFWIYGPGRMEITIIGLEPHPEDKKRGAYNRVTLSDIVQIEETQTIQHSMPAPKKRRR